MKKLNNTETELKKSVAYKKQRVEHRKGRLTESKRHEFYSKINTISKIRISKYSKTTLLVCSIIFPDDKLKNLEQGKWCDIIKTTLRKYFMQRKVQNTPNLN